MPYDIILGRDNADKKLFGNQGLIKIGRGYVSMGNYTSLSNNIFMDVARSHVVLIAGKRGSGKSYSIGVLAEEISSLPQEVARNISSLIFDTMGIFWTMKFKNEKDKDLLNKWDLKTKELPIKVLVPYGKAEDYKKREIPFDETFSIKPSSLETEDWITTFNLSMTSYLGTSIQKIINSLKKTNPDFNLEDVKTQTEKENISQETKQSIDSLFSAAESWGVFAKSGGTRIQDLVKPGLTTVLDLSVYSSIGAFNVRALVIGLVSRNLFKQRIDARKKEEIQSIHQSAISYDLHRETPLVWLFIDEAHEFLPKDSTTPATEALVQILREGRQPGISLVLATQQPGKIHSDVMTQSDIVLSHRVTSKTDVEALNQIMQSYLLESIKKTMDSLPNEKGSAIVLDDNSERIYSMRIRPRFTWHGGESPASVKPEVVI